MRRHTTQHLNQHLSIDLNTGALIDDLHRRVLLRGVNVGGRCKWAPYLPYDQEDAPHIERMCTQIHQWGFNVIRLSLNWQALQSNASNFNAKYIQHLEQWLENAQQHDIRVLLDFHQDLFAAPFCGNGFPLWTLPPEYQTTSRPSSRLWFLGYALDDRVRTCFERLWTNTDGLQDQFIDMWTHVLDQLGTYPSLVGIDIINEPSWGLDSNLKRFKQRHLMPFYQRVHAALHPIAPHLLLGYGMPGAECVDWSGDHHQRPHGEQFLYTPHVYDPSILLTKHGGLSIPPEPALAQLGRFQKQSATPVLLGEFGITHGAKDGPHWLERVYDAMDQHLLHGTIWEYSHSNERWNGEDLNLVDALFAPRPAAHAAARPYPAAVSADHFQYQYNAKQRCATLTYTPSHDAPTLIRVPAHLSIRRVHASHEHNNWICPANTIELTASSTITWHIEFTT